MGTISVHEFISLDGSVETPTWTADFGFDPAMGDDMGAVFAPCTALPLGRTTYEMFAQSWPERTADDDPGAPFFNDSTKYVVASALRDPSAWQHTEVLDGYDADRIRRLKADVEGDLYVSGSATLVRALLADGLVDDLHLFVYPTTRGGGPWLFDREATPATLALAGSRAYANGVLYLHYRPQPGG